MLGQSSVGSGGYQQGHVPGGSYISESVLAGIYENTNLRAKQINMLSFDCDRNPSLSGYTFDTSAALPSPLAVPTIALGGSDISAAQGSFSWPGAAGNVVITGLGFQPQLVMLVWSKTDTYNRPYTVGDADGAALGIGAASSSSSGEQFAFFGMENGSDPGYTVHTPGVCCVCQDGASILATGVLSSMDPGGFTIFFDGPDTGEALSVVPRLVGWIALRNDGPAGDPGGFKVGNATVPGSTGTVGYSGCGFPPDQVILAHGNATTTNTVEYGGAWGISMFDDTLSAALLNGPNLIPFPNFSARRLNTTAIAFGTNVSATVDAEASRSSMDADGFSLDWTNTAAPGRPFGWIAMHTTGDNAPCNTFLPQIYRWLKK